MGERREGVLVRVLVRVLVLVLVLVELGAQVGRRAQGGPAVRALRGQEARVQLLPQDVLLWKRRGGGGWHLSLQQAFPSEWDILVPEQGGAGEEAQERGSWGAAGASDGGRRSQGPAPVRSSCCHALGFGGGVPKGSRPMSQVSFPLWGCQPWAWLTTLLCQLPHLSVDAPAYLRGLF